MTLARLVLTHRLAIAALLLGSVLIALLGVTQLQLSLGSRVFYGDQDQAGRDFDRFVEFWGPDDDVLLIVAEVEDPGGMLRPDCLQAFANIAKTLRLHSSVREVHSPADARLPLPWEPGATRSLLELAQRMGDLLPGDVVLAAAPFVPALSRDGRVAAIAVRIDQSSDDVRAVAPVVKELISLAERESASVDLNLGFAGVPAVRAAFYERLIADQRLFVPLTFAFIGLGLGLAYRRLHAVLIPLGCAGISIVLLVGAMGAAGEPLGLLNQCYLTLLPVLTIADATHLIGHYHDGIERGLERKAAIADALSRAGPACLLTSLTTAAGFASLATSQAPIMRNFGLWAAAGVMGALCVTLLFVPLALSISRAKATSPTRPGMGSVRSAIRHPRRVLLSALAFTLVMAWGSSFVRIDNTLSGLLHAGHPVREAGNLVDAQLAGTLSIEVDLTAETGRLDDPEPLRGILAFERLAASLPTVRAVVGPAGPVTGAHQLLTGLKTLPTTAEGLDRAAHFAKELGAPNRIAPDAQRAHITIHVPDVGATAFAEIVSRLEIATQDLPPGIAVALTGTPRIAYAGVNQVTRDLRSSLIQVFAVITIVFALATRDLRLTLVCLIPNLIPVLGGYGLLGWTGIVLDPLAALVLVLALGVAVDDTIHLALGVRMRVRKGQDLNSAWIDTWAVSGRAVLLTSFVLAGGFAIGLASSFPALRLLGGLGSTVILLALAADMWLLPALLVRIWRPKNAQAPSLHRES